MNIYVELHSSLHHHCPPLTHMLRMLESSNVTRNVTDDIEIEIETQRKIYGGRLMDRQRGRDRYIPSLNIHTNTALYDMLFILVISVYTFNIT